MALVGVVAWGAVSLHAADNKQTRRSFDWTVDSGPEDTNNAAMLPSRANGLRSLEHDLSQPFRGLNSGNSGSLDGRFAPQYRPAPRIANPKLQDKDKAKGWLLDSDGEPIKDPFSGDKWDSDWAKSLKNSRSGSLESLDPKSSGSASDSSRTTDPTAFKNPFGASKDDNLPGTVRDSASNLRKLMEDTDSFSPATPRTSFADFFGLGDTSAAQSRENAHKAYMDQYRQILNTPTTPTPSQRAVSDLFATTPSSTSALTPLPASTPKKTSNPYEPQLGMINPRLSPEPVPDVNSRVLNSWDPMKPAQPAVTKPASKAVKSEPSFTAPRRMF